MEVASMNVRIGPIAIGRDDRPWIVRQVTPGRTTLRWRGFRADAWPGAPEMRGTTCSRSATSLPCGSLSVT